MQKHKVDVQPAIVKKLLVDQSLRVAACCRVSTGSGEQLGSLETQIEFCTKSIFKQFKWILAFLLMMGFYAELTSVNIYSDKI